MSAKENLSKALFDMFGVGNDPERTVQKDAAEAMAAETVESAVKLPVEVSAEAPVVEMKAYVYEKPKAAPPASHTYLAPDTVLEGTLRTTGDVTIVGTFRGDVFSEGDVTLHTSVTGNVTARNLTLVDCVLTGECTVTEKVDVQSGSSVKGNIQAKEVLCSGTVDGDIMASDDVRLEDSAHVKGNITAGSFSVDRGAFIQGKLAVS